MWGGVVCRVSVVYVVSVMWGVAVVCVGGECSVGGG